MTRPTRFSSWSGALLLLAACAPQSDFSAVTTNPITMTCDGGRTFTIAYANNFETAVVEAQGARLELPRLPTALSMTPTPRQSGTGFRTRSFEPLEGRGIGDRAQLGTQRDALGTAETTGVRYGSDDALLISGNRGAVLQVGDNIYSNCQVARS